MLKGEKVLKVLENRAFKDQKGILWQKKKCFKNALTAHHLTRENSLTASGNFSARCEFMNEIVP